jgi:hypothetical protein
MPDIEETTIPDLKRFDDINLRASFEPTPTENNMIPNEAVRSIELALMLFDPDEFMPKILRSVDDVADHRSRLRHCTYTNFAVTHLIHLVWKRIHEKRRKNLLYGLQAIKWLLNNRTDRAGPLEPRITDHLFELHALFVFDRLEDIRWCVSAILRDKALRPEQVRWLLEHATESEHVVNRLLRYPQYDPMIADWARATMKSNGLETRRAELLGRLIVDNLPSESGALPPETVLWGIYYSSVSHPVKQQLIERTISLETLEEGLKICLRLQLIEPLRALQERFTSRPS